jgi:hypothetical protein
MAQSDLIVAYLNQNQVMTVNFTNRYVGYLSSLPLINENQFWSMLDYSQKNGYTTVIATRKIKICNLTNSIDIVPGTQHVIAAWGNLFSNKNSFTDIEYHSAKNRSSSLLPLISSLNENIDLDMNEIEIFDFTVNVIN